MKRVIKLGGSLLLWPFWDRSLLTWLSNEVAALDLLVVGGGVWTDNIRRFADEFAVAEEPAHWAAVRAMSVTAQLAASILPGAELIDDWPATQVAAGTPRLLVLDVGPRLRSASADAGRGALPCSWQVTGDSIAAWVARQIDADELVLFKSVSPPANRTTLDELAACDFVDGYFPQAAAGVKRIRWFNLRQLSRGDLPAPTCDPLVIGRYTAHPAKAIQSHSHHLKNGAVLVIREAAVEDAGAVVEYLESACGESDFLTFGPGQFEATETEEEDFLRGHCESDNQLYLLGLLDGTVVSTLRFSAGSRAQVRHTGELGMSVRKAYWGLGIGSLMLDTLIDWARANGTTAKINLRVRTDSQRAIELYRRKGFVHEGTIRREIFLHGDYSDVFWMGLVL